MKGVSYIMAMANDTMTMPPVNPSGFLADRFENRNHSQYDESQQEKNHA
jgi:hypothetical protein